MALHNTPLFPLIAAFSLGLMLVACTDNDDIFDDDDTLQETGGTGNGSEDEADTRDTDTQEGDADTDTSDGPVCEGLFGRPNAKTGLNDEQCSPVCSCGGRNIIVGEPGEEFLDWLRSWTHSTPYDELLEDPYVNGPPEPDAPGTVCAVLPEPGEGPRGYELITFASREEAEDAGAFVTHTEGCGLCSNLHNLAVYMAQNDLTEPVRACGLKGISQGMEANVDCLLGLGFDLPCAQIWYYNTTHTRENCLDTCMALLTAPYHNADGTLNDCLQCDEDISGPVFKKYAGRTRRNSGLANSMCRPCHEVEYIPHDYH